LNDNRSGVRIYYTTNLKKYEAGTLIIGDIGNMPNPTLIGPGTGLQHFEYSCPTGCTSSFPYPLNAFGSVLHMHQIGSMIWSTQWLNNTAIRTERIDFWDFKLQQITTDPYVINPGDRINLHCVYQQQSDRSVKFYLGSDDEMCLLFVWYYPRIPNKDGACGYSYDNTTGGNMTWCMNDLLPISNPDVADPINLTKALQITFGQPCTTAKADSAGSGTNNKAAVGGVFGPLFLVVFIFLLWISQKKCAKKETQHEELR